MMLPGVPTGDTSRPAAPSEVAGAGEVGRGASSIGGGGDDDGDRAEEGGGERNSAGNRWPRQETLALIKIRSDMDFAFRDSSLKGPLWEEVSRKLADLGYHRSAKKCKEKFENVYKYHKRTKEGRTSKPEGKTYRFFDELEALEAHLPQLAPPPPHLLPAPPPAPTMPPAVEEVAPSLRLPFNSTSGVSISTCTTIVPQVTVPSLVNPMGSTVPNASLLSNLAPVPVPLPASQPVSIPTPQVQTSIAVTAGPTSAGHHFSNVSPGVISNSSSSSTSSDEDLQEKRRKRKREWKDFFGRLTSEVMHKQEELHARFLDALEKWERERNAREEAWRAQELAKMSQERELLAREKSAAAAKEAALVSLLQQITDQQNGKHTNLSPQPPQIQLRETLVLAVTPSKSAKSIEQQQPEQHQHHQTFLPTMALDTEVTETTRLDNGGGEINILAPSPSRWPKSEIQALITLRTSLDTKYQENGPKGPLWEEISASMRKLGYNRNPKRCKEKWENVNKYYKKVKESNKKRPEDSKTCPYFHQLDAIYREKARNAVSSSQMAPIMARPEQQWPGPQDHQRIGSGTNDPESENQNQEDDDEDYEEDEEDEGGGYEMVSSKQPSMAGIE